MAEWVVGFARDNRAATDMQDLPAMGKHHRQPAPTATHPPADSLGRRPAEQSPDANRNPWRLRSGPGAQKEKFGQTFGPGEKAH